jgi:hypothetical protein
MVQPIGPREEAVRRRSFTLAAIIVVAGLALSSTAFAIHDFSDVPDSHPFHEDISWLADSGITTGFPDGTYRPGQPVTRQSMAAFMRRLAGQDPDVDPVVDAATLDGMTANQLRQAGGMFEFADVIITGTTPGTATQVGTNLTILEAGSFVVTFGGMVNTSSDSALLSCVDDEDAALPGLTDIKVGDATIGYSDRVPFSAQDQVTSDGSEPVSVSCYLEVVTGGGSTVILDPTLSIIQTS